MTFSSSAITDGYVSINQTLWASSQPRETFFFVFDRHDTKKLIRHGPKICLDLSGGETISHTVHIAYIMLQFFLSLFPPPFVVRDWIVNFVRFLLRPAHPYFSAWSCYISIWKGSSQFPQLSLYNVAPPSWSGIDSMDYVQTLFNLPTSAQHSHALLWLLALVCASLSLKASREIGRWCL